MNSDRVRRENATESLLPVLVLVQIKESHANREPLIADFNLSPGQPGCREHRSGRLYANVKGDRGASARHEVPFRALILLSEISTRQQDGRRLVIEPGTHLHSFQPSCSGSRSLNVN